MELSIVRTRDDKEYCVIAEDNAILFSGTYSQCLCYAGGISLGRSHEESYKTAKEFQVMREFVESYHEN